MKLYRAIGLGVLALGVLVGCRPAGAPNAAPPNLSSPNVTLPPASHVVPTAIYLPSIEASTDKFTELAKNPDGTIQVPDDHTPDVAGWWTGSSVPGDPGTAIVIGHVDGYGKHGIFYNLSKLRVGDSVSVLRSDGQTATFQVTAVQKYDKDSFPTNVFYRTQAAPELHMDTCGGRYDPVHKRYLDAWVAYAKFVGLHPTNSGN